MPGVRDKIIINGFDVEADTFALLLAFKAARKLAKEIERAGLLQAAQQPFVAEQEAICQKLDAAYAEGIKEQRALNDKMRRWLDDQLGLNAP